MRPKTHLASLSIIWTLLLILLVSASTFARQLPLVSRKNPATVARWHKRLKLADDALRAGEWKKARKSYNNILNEMFDRIDRGEGAKGLLGLAVLGRAIAQAGLGNEHDALWDFWIATYLVPNFANANLSAYGAAGELLLSSSAESARLEVHANATGNGHFTGEVTRPIRKSTPAPKYPLGKRIACTKGLVITQIVIDRRGIPTNPKILSSTDPVLAFAVLESYRDWTFQPATVDGEPVAAIYNLSINFNIRNCPSTLTGAWKY